MDRTGVPYDDSILGAEIMTIAVASLVQESNTFSPVRTRYEDFSPVFGRAALERHAGRLTEMGGFIEVLRSARRRIEPVCAGWAITAGRVVKADFHRLVDDFAARLDGVEAPGALLIALHGALAAEGVDDADGYILSRARRILGPKVPIVVTLDLHANVTRRMVEQATAIVGYRTYPHVDLYETGMRAATMALRILENGFRPVMGFVKLPLIVPAENSQTGSGPMGRLMSHAAEGASIFPVQPWLDIEEMGASVVVVGDGDARNQAGALASEFWECRREFDVKLVPPRTAIRKALAISGGPVVFSESSDSTGSGSPGDSTGVLRPLLEADLPEPAAIFLVDPEAVARAIEAGVGNMVTMRIGGKFDRRNSRPVKVTGRVRLISDGRWTGQARGYNTGIETSMGPSAVLEVGQVRILIAGRSAMTVDPELYRSHGIEPRRMKIVVVKSPNGFRAEYEPMAKAVFMVDTPGVSTANLKTLPFRRVPRPMWPLDRNARFTSTGTAR
jgi:microcystin degradation protein MlrC